MAEKTLLIKALVIIKKKWIDEAGMGELLQPEHPHPLHGVVNFQVVLATNYSLSDGWFLEFEFYTKASNGEKRKRKLLVPKQEVLAVLEGENPEELPGFRPS